MKRKPLQSRFLHSLLVAAAAAGIWYAFVRPVERAYGAKRVELARMQKTLADFDKQCKGEGDLAAPLQQVNAYLSGVSGWMSLSTDASKIYDAIIRLGAQHGVRVERVDPSGGFTVNAAGQKTKGTKVPVKGASADVTGYRLTLRGPYERVSRFIAACETDLGPMKVKSFRMTPIGDDGRDVVGADVEIKQVRLSMPGVETTP